MTHNKKMQTQNRPIYKLIYNLLHLQKYFIILSPYEQYSYSVNNQQLHRSVEINIEFEALNSGFPE
jgi:hypothetical protein